MSVKIRLWIWLAEELGELIIFSCSRQYGTSTMNLRGIFALKFTIIFSSFLTIGIDCNPDAKRLYDDLLSNYNRLIRPVSNNTDTVLVKLGLRLSQLIDLVSDILILEFLMDSLSLILCRFHEFCVHINSWRWA